MSVKTTKKSLLVSKAKTAYGLLGEIAELVLAEPKRLRMTMFLSTDANRLLGFDPGAAPKCNTVGCICGWATVLRGTRKQIATQQDASIGLYDYGDMPGASILGLDSQQATQLFNPDTGISGQNGTKRQAIEVARRIKRFQKKHRAQLLATKLPNPASVSAT